METLQINTGVKQIAINGDPERVIEFNSSDVLFVEKFYMLISEFEARAKAYRAQAERLEANKAVDENGLFENMGEQFTMVRDACVFIREKIDDVFGAGTSQKAFGDTLSLDAISQFFNGILPFIQTSRTAKIERYTNAKPKRPKK